MRHSSQIRGSATEAAGCTPTDWATLGARILAAARQAASIHMTQAGKPHAKVTWAMDGAGLSMVATKSESAEPNE